MKKWIYRILLIVCVGVFCYSAYNLWLIYSSKNQIETETEELKKYVVKEDKKANQNILSVDWEQLKAQNEQIVAWIYVPDCDISFPVMQTSDNEYYLKHTSNKEYNERGAIFLDCEANSSFSDNNAIIYGHSVEDGGMFTQLKNYSDEAFFKEHPYFYLLTPNANYICDIYIYSKTDQSSVYYTTSFGDFKDSVLQEMKDEALYINDIEVDSPMVTLSTCDLDYGFNSDRRLVLSGILHVTKDEIVLDE